MMSPEASELAARHVGYARHVARSQPVRFSDDPGLEYSVALEALCEAASRWCDRGLQGTFAPFAASVICRRIIDELRSRTGREVTSARRLASTMSFGAGAGEDRTVEDVIGRDDVHIDAAVLEVDLHAAGLTEQEHQVIRATAQGWRLHEVAGWWGVSESLACRVRQEARRKISARLAG